MLSQTKIEAPKILEAPVYKIKDKVIGVAKAFIGDKEIDINLLADSDAERHDLKILLEKIIRQ